jgi:hypothetical protein
MVEPQAAQPRRENACAPSLITGGLALLGLIEPASAQTLRCTIAVKNQCSPDGECKRLTTPLWNEINFSTRIIKRCDSKGCDGYPAQFTNSGQYVNIDVPGHSMIAKLGEQGSFQEVVTLTDSVVVSFGLCRTQ